MFIFPYLPASKDHPYTSRSSHLCAFRCRPFTHRYGAIHWSVANIPGAIPLKKTNSPSLRRHQLSITPQLSMGLTSPSLICAGMLQRHHLVQVLCRSPWFCKLTSAVVPLVFRRHCFSPVLTNLCLLQSVSSSLMVPILADFVSI